MPVPVWSAAHNGIIGDASATAGAGQVNEFLGTHPIQYVYQGNPILSPFGSGFANWFLSLGYQDFDQAFTMSGTSIGRVAVPLLAFGDGADLLVSLCADSSGSPGPVITQTRVPASWITQLAAVSGIGSVPTVHQASMATQLTGNPLAAAQFNSLHLSNVTGTAWPYPYVTATAAPAATYYGGYMIQIGGVVNSSTTISNVYTIPYTLDGTLSEAIPQSAFPTPTDGSGKACVVIDSVTGGPVVVQAGGSTSFGGATNANVYTSALTTTTGALSAWSQQTSLPYVLQNQGTCGYNGYVYEIGGAVSGSPVATVSYAQVSNGQITGWSTTTPLPVPLLIPYVVAVNGFLFVMGGSNASFSPYSTVWYAPINANGSLGQWVAGPAVPTANGNLNQTVFANDNAICIQANGVGDVWFLGVTANGPAPSWLQANFAGWQFSGFLDQGNGIITMFGLNSSSYNVADLAVTPMISVPLPTTGLSNGTTYHVVLQQQGGDLNNGLSTHIDASVFTGNPTLQIANRGAYNWAAEPVPYAIPLQIFDDSVPAARTLPLHTWEDNGARITTLVSATTPDQRLLGVCEATKLAYALNRNQGFETGLAPWSVTGGTAAQSAAEVFEGSYSAQVTPSGTSTLVYLSTEQIPCMPGQWVTVSGWMWFTQAVTAQASMSVNWFNLAGTYSSTSSNSISVPAGTWTQLTNTFQVPAGCYFFTINPILGGTPAATNVFYVDQVHAHYTYNGPQSSTVSQIEATGTWPAVAVATGVLELA